MSDEYACLGLMLITHFLFWVWPHLFKLPIQVLRFQIYGVSHQSAEGSDDLTAGMAMGLEMD
tara:strand:+ start:1356 stop:1541 length:186 start_codon:yes stop_codon:yes gene_type:complete